MKNLFYRIVILIDGLAFLMDGLALVDFVLHPLAQDHTFHSTLYRAVTILGLVPFTLLVGFLILRRVPGNMVGPLLIMWSGSIANNSIREGIGPALFGLYYAYDLIFGWYGLFLMFVHFPDGKIQPPGVGRWIYRLLVFNFLTNTLIFLSTDVLDVPALPNIFFLPGLLPYAGWFVGVGLLLIMPILVLTPISLVQRFRKGSLLERQQIKWLAVFGAILGIYTILYLIAYRLLTGGPVMEPGVGLAGMIFYLCSGLFPALVIGISVLRYRLWDIDRIIRRTLAYSILTVILTLIYLGSAVILQTIFASLFQLGSSDLIIVLSTLAIAALFIPLRDRVQRSIDQRFFRQKYNAEQIIASFAATARSEVKVEPLATALLNNVEETLHPEGIGLWLNATPNKE